MNRTRLFVYGTLKQGFGSHSLLDGAEYLGPCSTGPGHFLLDCGNYPGMVRLAGSKAVQGELYLVDAATLARLDEHEGVPTLYTRESIELEGVEGEAEAYFYRRPMAGKALIPEGIWTGVNP
ncbi:MAG: gamma-glutamylcyclotransferase [Gemmataceae bacterium]|jgi:gamma-glutamylaminecyclotransferase|nr:gamma-glutamylcyclotransferase [Gemmataceae bacterium]